MKKVTNKSIFTAVLAIAFVACLLVYVMVFTKYNDKTDALKASNKALQTQVSELEVYYTNMQTYITDTKKMVAEIEELTDDYTSQANEEDFIMTAVDMQKESIINFEKVNIETEEVIHTIPLEVVEASGLEQYKEPIEFYERRASYGNTTDYANLKYALQVIFDKDNRVGINTVSYTRDKEDNNFIKGTIDVTYYTISGMNKPYEYPSMDSYLSGVQDLFGKMFYAEGEEKPAEEE